VGRLKYILGWLVLILAAVAVLCGLAFLIVLWDGGRLALGPCTPGREGAAEGVTGETKELLETPNFEASPKAIGDLKAGIVDERLVATLRAVTEEHRVCIDAFKEGHHFLPGVPDGPFIPAGYGKAGALFSNYTRSGSEVPRSVERGGSQSRSIIGVEARLVDYFSVIG
jgi:hypothetical protein